VGVPAYSGKVRRAGTSSGRSPRATASELKEVAHRGLKGLKVAPFYGCQILRPSKIMGLDRLLDRLDDLTERRLARAPR